MTDSTFTHSNKADLLVELGCEELPPKALDSVREAFFGAVKTGLENNNIDFESEGSRSFSTPRRLALLFKDVAAGQADQVQDRRGPSIKAAFDAAGNPTGAALGFARSVGKEVAELDTLKTDKGEWLTTRIHLPGKSLAELIFPILEQAIKQLPVPKPMRWANHDFSFIRPVHWLVALHGEHIIEGQLLGQVASNLTRGHRIHAPGPHEIPRGSEYAATLERAHVIADQDQRIAHIRDILEQEDSSVLIDDKLLSEVNNLVEWPVAVACTFEEEFLEVPHAALIASMQDHQKFFPVLADAGSGRVSNRFIAISNIDSSDISAVREGYERVIRPRLADARFFLDQDQKESLDSYLPRLDQLIFQKKIGTVGDKSRRLADFSFKLAEFLSLDSDLCARAAVLSKCDLMTQMVGEFPELQGLMGHHYALASGEKAEVAQAIGEHYAPRFAGDSIPGSAIGQIVSVADRADTLVGIFAADLRPSGNKDPFALRRAALGLVRILIEANLKLSLNRILALASNELAGRIAVDPALLVDVRDFIVERLRHYYREQNFSSELISAALASGWETLPDLDKRLRAIADFMGQDAAQSLATANKRIGNILSKAGQDISTHIETDQYILEEERRLFDEVRRIDEATRPLLANSDYTASLILLAELKGPVDEFFDGVMVMDEDPELRNKRLALLARLKSLFDQIADLSVLG